MRMQKSQSKQDIESTFVILPDHVQLSGKILKILSSKKKIIKQCRQEALTTDKSTDGSYPNDEVAYIPKQIPPFLKFAVVAD